MPSDVLVANILANEPPTLIVPQFRSSYEDMDVVLIASAYNGRPAATAVSITVHSNLSHAFQNINAVTRAGNSEALEITQIRKSLSIRTAGTRAAIYADINVPLISGTAPAQWYLRWTLGQPRQDGTPDLNKPYAIGYTIFKIIQSIRGSIMIASTFTREETTDTTLTYDYNIGSPRSRQVVHSWHSTLAHAVAGTNRITDNRPDVTVAPTPTQLSQYDLDTGRLARVGTLSMRTPAVSARTELYGRVEIWQPPLNNLLGNPVLVDSDAYTLIITNRSNPMLAVENVREIEGTRPTVTLRYVGENIPGDRWEINYANTQGQARNENWLADNDPRRPTNVTYQHATPRIGPNERTINMRMRLPYVDRNETIWARLSMVVVNPTDGTESYTHAYFRIIILNRVESCVVLGPDVTFDEETDDYEVMAWYNEGLPPATSMDVTVHADEPNAEADTNPLTGEYQLSARLSVTNITPIGNPTARRPFTLYLSSPDVDRDADWGVRVDINQPGFTSDPTD